MRQDSELSGWTCPEGSRTGSARAFPKASASTEDADSEREQGLCRGCSLFMVCYRPKKIEFGQIWRGHVCRKHGRQNGSRHGVIHTSCRDLVFAEFIFLDSLERYVSLGPRKFLIIMAKTLSGSGQGPSFTYHRSAWRGCRQSHRIFQRVGFWT